MEVDHTLVVDPASFWEAALQEAGDFLLDADFSSDSLHDLVNIDDGLFADLGLQDAPLIEEDPRWDVSLLPHHDSASEELDGRMGVFDQFAEELLTPGSSAETHAGAGVPDAKLLEPQGEAHDSSVGAEEVMAVFDPAMETRSVPELKMTSTPGTPDEEATRDRKRTREQVDSPDSSESPGPESLVVNPSDVLYFSGGESSEVDGSRSQKDVPLSKGTESVLTPEDNNDCKRQIRLEKNREAASQSRARKKSYVKDLELKCRMLETHVSQLQKVMSMTAMENAALKDELVRVKKPKAGVNFGAEPAVLESNSLPLEFLPHLLHHCPMGHTVGRFQGFLLVLLQLLLIAAVSGASGRQVNRPLQLDKERSSFGGGFWSYLYPMEQELYEGSNSGMARGCDFPRKKSRQHRWDRSHSGPPQWRLRRRKRCGSSRRVFGGQF